MKECHIIVNGLLMAFCLSCAIASRVYRKEIIFYYQIFSFKHGEWNYIYSVRDYALEKEITEKELESLIGIAKYSSGEVFWLKKFNLKPNGTEKTLYYYDQKQTKLLIFCLRDGKVMAVVKPEG